MKNNNYSEINKNRIKQLQRMSKVHQEKQLLINVALVCLFLIMIWNIWKIIEISSGYVESDVIYEKVENAVFISEDNKSSEISEELQSTDKSENEAASVKQYSHEIMLSINNEAAGYIRIPSVGISLPVVQTDNNRYYLNHSIEKSDNASGTLFIDYRVADGINAANVIIYGHNMKNGGMFARLSEFLSTENFSDSDKNKIYIYTEDEIRVFTIFAAYISKPYGEPYTYDVNDAAEYALAMKEKSILYSNEDVSEAVQVLTLSTCTGDGKERIIVQAFR